MASRNVFQAKEAIRLARYPFLLAGVENRKDMELTGCLKASSNQKEGRAIPSHISKTMEVVGDPRNSRGNNCLLRVKVLIRTSQP